MARVPTIGASVVLIRQQRSLKKEQIGGLLSLVAFIKRTYRSNSVFCDAELGRRVELVVHADADG